jgi:hypothetical protein
VLETRASPQSDSCVEEGRPLWIDVTSGLICIVVVARPHQCSPPRREEMPGNRATTRHDTLVRNRVNQLHEPEGSHALDHARPPHT